jgi:hypothetical protein
MAVLEQYNSIVMLQISLGGSDCGLCFDTPLFHSELVWSLEIHDLEQ